MIRALCFLKKKELLHRTVLFDERKRWDSNPRAREDYLISSQGRYDHFDTLPYELSGIRTMAIVLHSNQFDK